MEFGFLSSRVERTFKRLMLVNLLFNTRTCNYFNDSWIVVAMWNYLGTKSQRYLILLDYKSSYITPKLQAFCTV
jgi:hypothetical protein